MDHDTPQPVAKRVKVDKSAMTLARPKREKELPLPMPFELPNNWPPIVNEALEKESLIGNARPKFFSTIVSKIHCIKKYPTADEFFHVAQQSLAKYPFLSGPPNHKYVSIAILK